MLTKIFQSYIKLRDKVRSRLTIGKDEPFLSAFAKNAGKLFLILLTISLIGLAIFAVVKDLLVIGSLLAIGVGGIIYGIEGKAYYDELILVIGIPIAILNGFAGFIKFALYTNTQTGSFSTIITAVAFFLFGVLIIMTGSSRKSTEITISKEEA